jgi:hypothetical protein
MTGVPVGVVALDEVALQRVSVVKRRAVREWLADVNDAYAQQMHRCLRKTGYAGLPAPAPVPRHDYSRCSATTLDEC